MFTTPECIDQTFLLSIFTTPDVKQINSTQKRQFKIKVLDVISNILEDPVSLN